MTNDIRKPASRSYRDRDDASDAPADLNRREFMARSALLGAAAGAAGLGLHSGAAMAQSGDGGT
jgi:nitrous oxide reductase